MTKISRGHQVNIEKSENPVILGPNFVLSHVFWLSTQLIWHLIAQKYAIWTLKMIKVLKFSGLKWIYIAIVRPHAHIRSIHLVAAFPYWVCPKKLSKTQRLALISITWPMKTTPTAALEVLLIIPPLHSEEVVRPWAWLWRDNCLRFHQSSFQSSFMPIMATKSMEQHD